MTDLVACLTSMQGKSAWNHVKNLASAEGYWDKVILITDDEQKADFEIATPKYIVLIDFSQPIEDVVRDLSGELRKLVTSYEIALNFVSGNGKEHMALISAIMKLGIGFRLMARTREGISEI